MLVDRWH